MLHLALPLFLVEIGDADIIAAGGVIKAIGSRAIAGSLHAPVLPKNSIRRFYQPHGHMSNGMTTETMVTENHRIPRASGCFTTGRRSVAANKPGKLMSTITPHASIGDAVRRAVCHDYLK